MAGPRSLARRYAVLALYQWQIGGAAPAEVLRHFLDDPDWLHAMAEGLGERAADDPPLTRPGFDAQLFTELLRGVTDQADAIDAALAPLLDRPLHGIDPVERAVLRVGVYELLYSPAMPVAVIINEAIDLAKDFGAEQGHRYVNGVLDRLARQVRPHERRATPPKPRATR